MFIVGEVTFTVGGLAFTSEEVSITDDLLELKGGAPLVLTDDTFAAVVEDGFVSQGRLILVFLCGD
jgi:hypothetical protein